ncbi:MAG: hypothetical protein ACJ751_04725 [Niastella sp.]|uniref:hypothetical protein n=1 Tax=Niastella sp. TaxID=1869183 RepID=UPI003899881E
MDRITHVFDCTGSLIFFEPYVLDYLNDPIKLSQDQYLQAVGTISVPTLFFELNKNCPVRYYYRTNGLDKPLLIGVSFCNGIWQLKEYLENASVYFLLTLLKQRLGNGNVIIYVENEIVDDDPGV